MMLKTKLMRKTVTVAENQRVLMLKSQQLADVLLPGKHKMWDFKNELEFITFDGKKNDLSWPDVTGCYPGSIQPRLAFCGARPQRKRTILDVRLFALHRLLISIELFLIPVWIK